jgi:hypothetical protein
LADKLKCNWEAEFHEKIEMTVEEEMTLTSLYGAYGSWTLDKEDWAMWIHESLNYDCFDPLGIPLEHTLSLEIVLGWSLFRISVVILAPILLSLALGLWFQSKNINDLATVQTAWSIASYVATAGGRKLSQLSTPIKIWH